MMILGIYLQTKSYQLAEDTNQDIFHLMLKEGDVKTAKEMVK